MESAVCYSKTSTLQKEDGMKLLNKLCPGEDDHVLDLGCGIGFLAKEVAERVGTKGYVVAIDPDNSRIELAQKTRATYNNIQFMVGDDQNYPVDDQYDIIFSTSVVHWIINKEAAFKKVYESLKPGGQFGFTSQDNPQMHEVLMEALHLCGPKTVKDTVGLFHWESASYYEQLAASLGFEVTIMEVKNRQLAFPDIESFVDFFYGVFHGKFDRTVPAIDGFKKKYEGHTFIVNVPRLTAILTKQSNNC